jgi:hypothetical protein
MIHSVSEFAQPLLLPAGSCFKTKEKSVQQIVRRGAAPEIFVSTAKYVGHAVSVNPRYRSLTWLW